MSITLRDICRHGYIVGDCMECDLEAQTARAAELEDALREILGSVGEYAPVDTYVSTSALERARKLLGGAS